jgi:hypothetical protein
VGFVIFDARAPGRRFEHFPDYIRKQAGEVQKYVTRRRTSARTCI